MDNSESWLQVLQAARTGARDIIMLQRCPLCGGALRFRYDPEERAKVRVNCMGCRWAAACDQVPAERPWVNTVGPDVTTQPGHRSGDTNRSE